MTKPLAAVCAALLLLQGCATEWRADAPTRPISYELPAYRAERSVGNLRRLAIVPVRISLVGRFGMPLSGSSDESASFGKQFGESAATYLSMEKGYETVLVEGEGGAWRPEVVAHPEHGSIGELKAAWEVAGTASESQAVARRLGRALDVDGVIVIWIEYSTIKPGDDVESVTWGVLNLFLANAPLFYDLSHTSAEATILETASGNPVWQMRLSGKGSMSAYGSPVSAQQFFENLENAIPAQLVR